MKIAPCKGCTERTPTCHAGCEIYLNWKEKNKLPKQEEDQATTFIIEGCYKRQKRYGRGK